jgi:septum formation protein
MNPRIVLASASPRRADVLRQLGVEALVRPADVDERYMAGETPVEYVERLARWKADTVCDGAEDVLVVGGDTVVLHEGRVLSKPEDEAHAVSMLLSLSGGTHEVLSGIAISGAHGMVSGVARTEVRMRSFGRELTESYVATGEPMDKAGGYGLQGKGAALIEGVAGDYYAVIGFPVGAFLDLLLRVGWRFEFGQWTRVTDTD